MKECIKCHKIKELDEFPVRKNSPDGHRSDCKECKAVYLKAYHASPPAKEILPEGKKRCTVCDEIMEYAEFGKNNKNKDGLKSYCKACKRKESRQYNRTHKEYFKKYREENKEKLYADAKAYREENKKVLIEKKKIYALNNKTVAEQRKKNWYEKNKNRILSEKKERYKKNRKEIIAREQRYIKNNVQAKIRHALRSRLYQAINRGSKSGSAVSDLGCSIKFFKEYMESMFYSSPEVNKTMTWENFGIGGWHIDHIIPLSSFDLTDRCQFLKAVYYTNLQPLWAEDNLKKGAMIPNIE